MDSAAPFSSDSPIEQAVENILHAANQQHGANITDAFRDALNAIAHHPGRFDALTRIAARLPELTAPRGAGLLAVWLGGAVEKGADPEPAIPHLFGTLLRWSRTVSLPEPDAEGNPPGELVLSEETLGGLEWLGQGLVAHLAQSPSTRSVYAAREEVLAELERVEPVSSGCLWVREILRKCSGTLVVLHVAGRKGVRVEYRNLSNNFHLFTLLQGALAEAGTGRMPGSKRVSAEVLAIARGEADGAAHDSVWWHYGPGNVPESNVVASVWGEASPLTIPEIEGEQVLLLWPMQLSSRSWDGGFFTPRLAAAPASVTVIEELGADQIEAWWAKLKLPRLKEKPWWKLW